uniref:Uncharacterized mitochondrial protein AtMg00240-like n=1 Tax=Nicotiana tabacum TaxID=4097 RepID=A0A1S4AW13_TOBAC|nr:PREDICTED: uncharacterized mitochondrial protein AtMg00240-like [Nicotiana tabacum]
MTRPDIAFAVQVLSQYIYYSKVSHIEAALRVVRYIKQAPGLGLFMPAKSAEKLIAYYDSDWGSCIKSRRPVTGYLVKYGNALVNYSELKGGYECFGVNYVDTRPIEKSPDENEQEKAKKNWATAHYDCGWAAVKEGK